VEFFRKKIPGFRLVAIASGSGKRFGRRSKMDGGTREKFFERDRHDSQEFELGRVIAMADYKIENNSTIDDFRRAIDGLMQKI
jgi:dephospho-CoA kinase